MATVAISGLPAATGVAGADVTPIVQSATTKKVTFSAIFAAPPAIGGTTPAAGTFTTLSATGAVTFTGTNQATTLGTAGTSTEASALYLEGGTGAGGGGVVQFQKNGALTGAVAMASRLLGGTTSNMAYYAAAGLGHNWYANGNVTVASPNMSLTSTGLAVTGTLGLTGSAATETKSFSAGGTTTSANYWQISNTGGNLYIGVDNYSGAALITGGTAYGSVIGTNNNTTLHLISNGTSIAQITTTGLAVTGTVNINGTAASTTAGQVQFGSTTQSTIGANGAASALTANPLGYLIAYLGTTKIIIPYYNG